MSNYSIYNINERTGIAIPPITREQSRSNIFITQRQALRTSEKFKLDLRQVSTSPEKTSEKETKPSPTKEEPEEPKLIIDQQAILQKKINIFARSPERENKINIFNNSKSVNLFTIAQQPGGLNIFKDTFSAKPLVTSQDDDDGSQNSSSQAQDPKHQEMKVNEEVEMKFTYEKYYQKLAQFKVIKFRAGEGVVKQGVIVSLEKSTKGEKVLYFFVRNQTTKIIIYDAFLIPLSKPESFMNKKENIKLTVGKINKIQTQTELETKKHREQIKLQFESPEHAQQFSEIIANFFKPE